MLKVCFVSDFVRVRSQKVKVDLCKCKLCAKIMCLQVVASTSVPIMLYNFVIIRVFLALLLLPLLQILQIYKEIRDRHFTNVFGFLSLKAKELQVGYDVR